MIIIYIILAVFAGVTIVLTRAINGKLAQKLTILDSTIINYISGLIFSLIFLLFNLKTIQTSIHFNTIPIWAYLGGVVGIGVVVLSTYLVPRVPAFYLTLFIFVGQLTFSMIIDFALTSKFQFTKLIGITLVFLGLLFNLNVDRKVKKEAC